MSESPAWTADAVPNLDGRTIVVTGANSGIGFEAALVFARKGAHVVLACRDPRRAAGAVDAIRAARANASVEVAALDLASLASIRACAAALRGTLRRIDVLCNNAGVMALPYRQTADGFEMQIGTNHLGHFALTGLLLPLLLDAPGARIVTVSSGAHRMGKIRFDDLHWQQRYAKWSAYGQSKLANLLFAYELQRRLEAAKTPTISVACHPGYAATNLQFVGPRMEGSTLMERLTGLGNRLLAQSAAMGALPTLYAATAGDVRGGDYIGPNGIGELWGTPRKVGSNARSRDREAAARLWTLSEQLTGVRFEPIATH
jgi:NAD(P)-dependent dehydrogenase (short-subunit alcohol dehydrogenase family)